MQHEGKFSLGELFEISIGDITVRTKLLEIVSDTEMVILQPTLKGAPVRAEDKDVPFTFYRPNGCYRFSARMFPPFRKDNLILCRAVRVTEIQRIQRRQCYRLPIVLDTVMYTEEDGQKTQRYKGKTIDLSEKSVALSCFTRFEPDTPLTVEIRLSESDTIVLKASVLRCVKPMKQTDPYEIVLIFTDPHEKARILRKYIFMQQVLSRKKNIDKD